MFPYPDMPLSDLADAAERMGDALLQPKPRSPEQRAELARQCAFLLFALARRAAPYRSDRRFQRILNRDLVSTFYSWSVRECDHVRFLALQRACDFARVRSVDLRRLAPHQSDVSLQRALEHIQGLADLRGRTTRP